MEDQVCRECCFHCAHLAGEADGERLFKFCARLSGRHQIVSCLANLSHAQARFEGYVRDAQGKIEGAVIVCDRGSGYGFNDGEERVVLRAHQSHRFTHSYTDTSDGAWDNGFYTVTLTLLPFDEAACCWKGL